MKPYRPYHPLLPTVDQAAENHDSLLSDHVPIVASLALEDKQGSDTLRILSWNVMESDSANGFARPGAPGARYGETEEQTNARHRRIAESLQCYLKEHSPDFIALQEIVGNGDDRYGPPLLFTNIMALIPEKYHPVKIKAADGSTEVLDAFGCLTLFNSETIGLDAVMESKTYNDLKHFHLGGCFTYFKHLKSGKVVKLLNIHAGFNEHPAGHEAAIRGFLCDKDDNTATVVVGDFNCTIGPLAKSNTGNYNITTSAATTNFRYGEATPVDQRLQQGGYAIDGAFYSCAGSQVLRQAPIDHVDLKNAELITPLDRPALSESATNELQLAEITKPRLIIMIDGSYDTLNYCGDHTFPEYQTILRNALDNQEVTVRVTKTLDNETGVAVLNLNEEQRQYLMDKEPGLQLQVINDALTGRSYHYLSASGFGARPSHIAWNFEKLNLALMGLCRLYAFKKIYAALRDGQKTFLKKDFLEKHHALAEAGNPHCLLEKQIELNVSRNSQSRTAVAWMLADRYMENCHPENQALLKEVYEECYRRSSYFTKSTLSGLTLWRSSKVHEALEKRDITKDDMTEGSRTLAIVSALGNKK